MESFWKEYTIFLSAKKEFIYDIQSKNTNCIVIQNYNVTNVKAGIKPHAHELVLNPNRTGFINRPFPLRYVYLHAVKPTPVSIIETIVQNPVNKFIRQETTKNISIDTVNVIIQNTPLKICQRDVFRPQVRAWGVPPFTVRRSKFIYDLGRYGAPTINILLRSVPPTRHRPLLTSYRIYVFNENIGYIRLARIRFPSTRRRHPIPPEIHIWSDNVKVFFINDFVAYLSIANNTFRYISIIGTNATVNFSDRIVIPIR